jgi:hypothetical protein
MKKYMQSVWSQWLWGLFFSFVLAEGLWQIELEPLIGQINVLSQNNLHISQKLKNLRKDSADMPWSAPQLYRWLSVSQQHFGIHIVSVSSEREGIQLVLEGPLQNMTVVLQQLARSGLKLLSWQRDHEQMTLLLNSVSVQELGVAQNKWIGEAGSPQQRYCVYQTGQTISLRKKDKAC